MKLSKNEKLKTMCPPSYHQNCFVAYSCAKVVQLHTAGSNSYNSAQQVKQEE